MDNNRACSNPGGGSVSILIYLFGTIGFVVLLACAVVLLLSTAAQSQEKRKEDFKSRRIARQPWDAQSADGRGNR
jgi:hypothetical protein